MDFPGVAERSRRAAANRHRRELVSIAGRVRQHSTADLGCFDSVFVIVQPEVGYFARPDALGFVSNSFLEKLGRVTLDCATGSMTTWK
jgi:hypothetical protein